MCGGRQSSRCLGNLTGLSGPAVLSHLEASGGILECVEQWHLQWECQEMPFGNGENPPAFVQLHTQWSAGVQRFSSGENPVRKTTGTSAFMERKRERPAGDARNPPLKPFSPAHFQGDAPLGEAGGSRGTRSCLSCWGEQHPGRAGPASPGIDIPSTRCSCLPPLLHGCDLLTSQAQHRGIEFTGG